MRLWGAKVGGLGLVLAGAAFGGRAYAEPLDPVAAEAFFAEGRELLKEQKFAEACSKFEASQRLDPAIGTLMNLADCYERSGRFASAWVAFREAAGAASSAHQAPRAAHARERAAALEPRLCRLAVIVDRSDPRTVLRDGRPVDASVWNEPVPIDAGHHVITVQKDSTELLKREVDVVPMASGRCETVSITIPLDASVAKAQVAAPVATTLSSPATPGASSREPPSSEPHAGYAEPETGRRNPLVPALPLTVVGAGVVGMGLGAYFGLHAKSEWDTATAGCTSAGCGPSSQSLAASARSDAAIGSVAFIAGAALAVGGVVLWLVLPARDRSGASVAIAPTTTGSSHGVSAIGRF